jgi:putative transposase
VPYWNDSCAETSSGLWLPTVTDSPVSASTSSPSSSNTTAARSWFSINQWINPEKPNSPPIYSPSSITSRVECTVGEVIKAKRIRLYPTPEQKTLFRQWLGTSRYVYNETVKHLGLPKEERERHWMGAAKQILASLPDWAGPIPYQIKKIAVEDAYKAFSNGIRRWKQTGEPFDLRFRSRKNPKQSCFIPSSALKDAGVYPRIAGSLKRAEDFPDNPRDSRLVFEQGRWFVIVPYRVPIIPTENQGRVVALDPGIRTFLTGFAEDQAFKLGDGDFARIARLCRHLDRLLSRIAKARCRQKARLKKAANRLRWKIRDLVDELHFQAIRFLLDRFDLILLPTFETQEMARRSKRRIRAKSVRSLLGYAFFRFGQRLEAAAKRLGKVVLRVNEAYTSKTASWTGEIKPIGGAKTITSGGVTVDRDINGARGIFLRALVDTPSLRNECACVGAC